MKPTLIHRGSLRLLPAALVPGVALALLALRWFPTARPTVTPTSPEQKLLRRSERLMRKLGERQKPLTLSIQPGGQPRRRGAPPPFVQVDCAAPSGEHLASLNWDWQTQELASLSRQAPSDRDAPDRPLTQAQAQARALDWLRRLELLAPREKPSSLTLASRAQNLWSFHILAGRRRIRVTLQRRTGELLWLVSRLQD